MLGVTYPIICGAMTWVSEPQLVSKVCNAGAFASLACGNMPSSTLEQQITKTRELTNNPFAVNLITVAPNYKSHLDVVTSANLPVIIFAGSLPKDQEIVAYCRGPYCVLSVEAVDFLRKQGFQAVRLEEGVQDWRALGFPVTMGEDA